MAEEENSNDKYCKVCFQYLTSPKDTESRAFMVSGECNPLPDWAAKAVYEDFQQAFGLNSATLKDVPKTCAEAAESQAFKRGDVVQLKSGGIVMTVTENSCSDWLEVRFSHNESIGTDEIHCECLKLWQEEVPF